MNHIYDSSLNTKETVHQYTAKMEHILEQFILDWHRLRVFVQLRDRSGQNVNETQYINGGPSRKYIRPHVDTFVEHSLNSFTWGVVQKCTTV